VSGTSTSVKLGLLGAALLVVLAVGWFVLIAPKRSEASRLQQQIDDTRVQIATARAGSPQSQGPAIKVADLFELSRAMPDQADIPEVLLQLSDIAAQTGVNFQSIAPQAPVSLGQYEQISISLVFEGHFYDLSDFLYRLRNLVGVHRGVLDTTGRLFSVDSISFAQGDLQFPQVKATLTVSAYVFGDGSPPPLPAASGSAAAGTAPATTTPATSASGSATTPIPPSPAGATAAGA
jgi:Pilus assembly protein, PilO